MEAVGKAKDKKPPDLYKDLNYIWEIFCALSSSRTRDDSIRFSEIESYLNLSRIFSLEHRQEVAHLIRVMDEEYLKYMREKYAKRSERN